MAVDFYDKALTAKIKALFDNTVFQARDLTLKTVTDTKAEVKFPLVSIFRPDGWSIDSSTWNLETKFLNGIHQIPVNLVYTIDIYARTREDLETFTSELLLYLLRNRGIQVVYTSADGSELANVRTSLDYVSGPERTSELDDKTVGRPYRYTLTFKLSNAYIYEFGGDKPTEAGYTPIVTQVIVEVKPVVDVVAEDGTHKTEYIDKEVFYGKN